MTPEKRLEQYLKKNGISRQQLADALSISLSSVAMYFSGHHRIRPVVALAIEAACGISADWIMTGKGSPKASELKLSASATEIGKMYEKLSPQHRQIARTTLHGFFRLTHADE